MEKVTIQVIKTGEVRIVPELAFGGDHCSMIKASGVFASDKKREWFPVNVFLVDHPKHGKLLLDMGWDRSMSPEGVFDKQAQIKSLGSRLLYRVNQGVVPKGETASEQLEAMGIKTSEIDKVIISHLDCDHANGLPQFGDAKEVLIAKTEMDYAKHSQPAVRFYRKWWEGLENIKLYEWNDNQGPFGRSYDVFGDGSVELINIPGHTAGLVATKITQPDGHYFLYFGDGGYAEKSWKEMITSGISMDKKAQKESLAWIREMSLDPMCVASWACHDPELTPRTIEF